MKSPHFSSLVAGTVLQRIGVNKVVQIAAAAEEEEEEKEALTSLVGEH